MAADAPAALIDSLGRRVSLGETAVAALPLGEGVALVSGDGIVRLYAANADELWASAPLHHGGLLTAMSDQGRRLITTGDDGAVMAIDPQSAGTRLAHYKGAFVDAAAVSKSRIAIGLGREVAILSAEGAESHRFTLPATAIALAFEPNGRRFAAAHKDGVTIAFADNPKSTPKLLTWKGAHTGIVWSQDAKFIITAMQENALHGWRLQDGQHFRMTGYPARIRAMSFAHDGKWLATSGAAEIVLWPFQSQAGPINQQGAIAGECTTPTTLVACHPTRPLVAAGSTEGEVALFALNGQGRPILVAPARFETPGAEITALGWSADGRLLAYAADDGEGGVIDFSEAMGA